MRRLDFVEPSTTQSMIMSMFAVKLSLENVTNTLQEDTGHDLHQAHDYAIYV